LHSRKNSRGWPRALGPQKPTAVETAAITIADWTGGTADTDRVVQEAWEEKWLKERDGRAVTRPADDFDHRQEILWERADVRTRRDFYSVLQGISPTAARLTRRILGWLMDSGRLPMYNLARRLELELAV
ncbi:hypothetical protein N658DRAFT_424170, partial [Parathielavia hyrcaniae]